MKENKSQRRWGSPSQQSTFELTEAKAACTGPVWVCTRWGSELTDLTHTPIPNLEAISIGSYLRPKL